MKLTEVQIEEHLNQTEGWKRENGKWIIKKYRFPSFPESIAFVNLVAQASEELNHHPFIAIDYKLVTLRMTTWHDGGLTELDFTAATAYDRAYAPS
ncbi:4a-hydroxytetrahydrobiopterin dehydratase [Paenibacillus castaneae]|uniref:4a-hydroxytetrahydrobiopterin dehydratase n=1 Tax=Paenibacillus castaneae TaxID=474957 RepID=UPI000C9ABF07|nr:4a-hydroxytetrahydrobiopterin dehydratase [Paenibacillus castaneae]NIK80205.1 4a-hydroxytetrahydrobiopterin dehydratase [Paenibacillus castaneae]